MRFRVLLLAVVVLSVAGSAAAASGKPKLVQVVRHEGVLTARLTYTRSGGAMRPTLTIRRNGTLLLERRVCPADFRGESCRWLSPSVGFRRVAGDTPAVVVDAYSGGAHCCFYSFIALVGAKTSWIVHDWKDPGYHGVRIDGRYYFVSGDDRFAYAFTAFAFSYLPVQIWTVDEGDRLANVTRSLPALVRADARRAWKGYVRTRGNHSLTDVGTLSAWCADEYLLHEGARCAGALRRQFEAGYLAERTGGTGGRTFIRQLNRDLERWGYKRT